MWLRLATTSRISEAALPETGLARAVREHDTPALYGWLLDLFSHQGVSDAIAWRYMEEHGRVSWAEVDQALKAGPSLPPARQPLALPRLPLQQDLGHLR
jgi:hypothetical protein